MTQSWQGILELDYRKSDRATLVGHSYSKAPLKIQRAFYPEGESVCHSTILHTAGGMVGGDRLSLQVALQPHTHVVLTTAAASKIYLSQSEVAQQDLHLHIGESACLEWLPQEIIVFNGAQYFQTTRVELHANALWFGWESIRFGRTAAGEKFVSGNWRSHTEVWQSGRPLWLDRQWLPGSAKLISSPHALAGKAIAASFVMIGKTVSAELLTEMRALGHKDQSVRKSQGELGITRLLAGVLCRYRGNSSEEAQEWFQSIWHLLRVTYLDRSACPPRVWQTRRRANE